MFFDMYGNPIIPAVKEHIANSHRELNINPNDMQFVYFFYQDGRPINITPNNIKMFIAQSLGCTDYYYNMTFKDIDIRTAPKLNEWMHSCVYVGYEKMDVKQLILFNGRTMVYVAYAVCPAFPNCKTIHIIMDKDVCAF